MIVRSFAVAAVMTCLGLLGVQSAAAKPRCAGQKATIVGTGGRDNLKGTGGRDVIVAGAGRDRITARGGRDIICAGPGRDAASGGKGRDVIDAGAGGDSILAGLGSDKVFGGPGADLIIGGPGGEHAVGGGGDDRIFGGQQDDDVFGSAGNDVIIGEHGFDHLNGGIGDDWLRPDSGGGQSDGGPGTDWVSFATTADHGVRELIDQGQDRPNWGYRGFESVVGTRFIDTIRNGSGNSYGRVPFVGVALGLGYHENPSDPYVRRDRCDGFLNGADCGSSDLPPAPTVLMDQSPQDPGVSVVGGSGTDQIAISRTEAGVRAQSAAPLSAGPGCAGGGTTSVLCPVTAPGYITMSGGPGDDVLRVEGSWGATTTVVLNGGSGSDLLAGGPGDEILEAGDEAGDYREPAPATTTTSADTLLGNGGDDALSTGEAGPDVLRGGGGSDQLVVLGSVCEGHTLDGGAGGSDIAGFARSGNLVARLGGFARDKRRNRSEPCDHSRVSAKNEILEGTGGDDVLIGSPGNDYLILGGEGNDRIRGLGGNDHLRGDAGADFLYGGGGVDILEAQDGRQDHQLNCGPGGGIAHRDKADGPARGCGPGGDRRH